jgi:endonuclease/exonuclease/phosphatase family metal-dependent hydrolase
MRVLTLNIWKDEGDLAARLEMIAEECRLLQPDMICLQEVYADATMDAGKWLADALGLTRVGVPARIKQRSGVLSSSGLAILSRLQPLAEESLDLPTSAADGGRKALYGDFETFKGPLRVVSLHLSHLKAEEGDMLRSQQLAAIWSCASQGWDRPIILAGDFNATRKATCFDWLAQQSTITGTDSLLPQATSLRHQPNALIDHILFAGRSGWELNGAELCFTGVDATTGCFASDHFGILASFNPID